jgi:hypothetical protein
MTPHSILLSGIDGANPLGFLAALGTLRTLTHGDGELRPRLSWTVETGAWRPVLSTTRTLSETDLVDRLDAQLKAMVGHAAWALGDNLNVEPDAYRRYAREAALAATPGENVHAEFAAAFACDAITETDAKKRLIVRDTAFRTMSGAGHQHFLGFMRQLAVLTEPADLHKALFETWRHDDDKPSMRWDPADDRRYALRWGEPSGDPIKTVRGANRLAIEGLALLPVMPRGSRLETTGFVTAGSRGTWFSWPIWSGSLSLPVVRSLLADRRIRDARMHREELARIGVEAVFRSQRLTVDKYRNFTMGQPV